MCTATICGRISEVGFSQFGIRQLPRVELATLWKPPKYRISCYLVFFRSLPPKDQMTQRNRFCSEVCLSLPKRASSMYQSHTIIRGVYQLSLLRPSSSPLRRASSHFRHIHFIQDSIVRDNLIPFILVCRLCRRWISGTCRTIQSSFSTGYHNVGLL